jgi:hypothetical protein
MSTSRSGPGSRGCAGDAVPAAKKKAIAALAEDVGTFLLEEIGHGRSFSLDSEDAMRERAADVKKL